MCNVCGCGTGETRIDGEAVDHEQEHEHVQADGTVHRHSHGPAGQKWAPVAAGHAHSHGPEGEHVHEDMDGSLHYGHGPAGAHAPGMSQAQMVKIEQNILAKNDGFAERNRSWLAERGILALNLVSSPGSGKTTLLVRTIEALKRRVPVAVVEGDQQTSFDAERIRATGAPALQINTGKGCHLDAHMVGRALEKLAPSDNSVLLIENVGNLVCPAAFDLGEAAKVVVLSVTEGEDKPLKYPDMFAAASLMLVNKIDLLPYLNFPVDKAIEYALRVNPQLQVIQVSATTGAGFDAWLGWIDVRLAEAVAARTR
ncbi:hydrogenase nickel incorporation protein HypB [Zoogloea sp.]|uniref:hydrogenase nickel incorporation protein HypB n=1 Tax=Zoogloea sp. TaxID=49181 RepID=UPI002585E674|nr:hydrogenase nickel incorporation protein HypB [Zoogloea sp.]MDD2670081.1 hydrogenase nickel incorporation protein HypB [Zoogloea sp.]